MLVCINQKLFGKIAPAFFEISIFQQFLQIRAQRAETRRVMYARSFCPTIHDNGKNHDLP